MQTVPGRTREGRPVGEGQGPPEQGPRRLWPGLGSQVWAPQASCAPLTGLTMATASGTSKANISPASVARRSASTRPRPLPWSRAAWPAWTPIPSCCLSWAPCPPSTPESGHPPAPPPLRQPLRVAPPCRPLSSCLTCCSHPHAGLGTAISHSPFTFRLEAPARPWRSDSPSPRAGSSREGLQGWPPAPSSADV